SRRRHTRLQGDWSSDVCSSDLDLALVRGAQIGFGEAAGAADALGDVLAGQLEMDAAQVRARRGMNRERLIQLADDIVKPARLHTDRKSTRLNSSHLVISYAVFC